MCYFIVMPKNIYEIAYELRMELYHKIFVVTSIIVVFFLVTSLFLRFILFPVMVRSVSMEPGIPADTAVFVTPLVSRPSRGDVVLLEPLELKERGLHKKLIDLLVGFVTLQRYFPFDSSPAVSEHPCVRRVFAVPGDSIYMQDYMLYIRPAGAVQYLTEYEVIEKDYEARIEAAPAGWDTELGVVGSMEPVTLGRNEYFVLCDNRNSGVDSRMWGIISGDEIRGRVLMAYFPFSHLKLY